MRRLFVIVFALALVVSLYHCADNPVDEGRPFDRTAADSTASYWLMELGDTIAAMGDMDTEALRDLDFTHIRSGFRDALSHHAGNGIAHLGLAILEILELNYSSDIWEVVDSISAWSGDFPRFYVTASSRDRYRHALLGRQFSLLVEVPFAFTVRRIMTFPQNVTVDRIQQIIENTIIPALDRAIGHLATVESDPDMLLEITYQDEGVVETIVIDLGEVYVFDASIHALRAAFETAVAYDVDLFGPDGTYAWIDYIRGVTESVSPFFGIPCLRGEVVPGVEGDTLIAALISNPSGEIDSVLIRVAHHNIVNRRDFLKLRDDGSFLDAAHDDLLRIVTKLEASVDFIRNRTDESEHNVIKLSNLTDLESGLGDPAGPNFAQHFSTVEDVLAWTRDFISGPITFEEELGSSGTLFQWKMDMSALFQNPVSDWKTMLPYHQWNLPAGPWIEWYLHLQYEEENFDDPIEWGFFENGRCVTKVLHNIVYIKMYGGYNSLGNFPFIELLDGPGGNVIPEGTFPYFPPKAYTFGGLLPDMTRARWEQLLMILE